MTTQQIDFERLSTAFKKLFTANTPEESLAILQQHPELLSEQADKLLEQFIHHAREQGNENEAQLFSHLRKMLQSFRHAIAEAQGNERNDMPSQFRADIKQAKAAQARYQQGGSVQALDEAIVAWERILQHPDFVIVGADKFCLIVLNDSAITYARRYQIASDFRDLEVAIAAWQQAVALTRQHSPNSPDLPMFLNNLGNGLRNRYARTGEVGDLERGISAYQEAVAFTCQHFPNSPGLHKSLGNLGDGLTDRYARTSDVEDLEQGIKAFQEAVALTREHFPNSHDLLDSLNSFGTGLSTRYAHTGDVEDLERGIKAFQEAVALTREHFPNSPDLPSRLSNLGTGLSNRYARTGDVKDLERGISAFQEAVALTRQHFPNSLDLPSLLNNLGAGLSNRYARTGDVKVLEQSIQVNQEAVALTRQHFPNSPDLPGSLNNLGTGLYDSYVRTGDVKDLERGISAYQEAVALIRQHFPNSPDLPGSLNNLGTGLRDRYARTGEVGDLERGISAYQEAVALTRQLFPNSPKLPSYLNNLGTGLSYRYARTGEVGDLERDIEASQESVALTRQNFPNSPDLPDQLSNLGAGLRDSYARTGDMGDLERGISTSQEAVALTREHFPNSPSLPSLLNNLGGGLSTRYARTGDVKDLEQGIEAYQQATQQGLDIDTNASLGSARNWLRWAFNRQAWAEVAQAYDYAYQASTRLVQIQLTRQHQESWLKESQGLAAHAAYAFAKDNKLQKAVVTLERGLAQLLSEALARDWADLEQLKVQGYSDLYHRYQQAVNDWHNAQHVQAKDVYTHLRAAREALEKTIAAIRQVDGYADFLMAPEFQDIMAAVKDSALVYLAVTEKGGLALIVYDNREITPVWLPELTEDSLEYTLANKEPPDTGYLRAYDDWLRHPKENSYRQQWFTSLEKTTQLLWKQVMGPLIQALPKQATVTLIPVGRLGLLPLHAAWTEDNNTPTGKRYALDALTISYAPNARSLTQARKVAHRVTADRLLAVDEPKPVTNDKGEALPLPSSEYEVQCVVEKFAQPHIFKHEAATRQAILDNLADYTVLHFSCHGSANLNKPLESALIMANNEPLTVKDFLDLRLNGVRLATLSACETGIPGMDLPDEVVNLPAGLLQAGVAGVVASLWSVSDRSTALLMTKFYHTVTTLWEEQGTQASIAPALQAAQCWLRDATKEELEQWSKELPLDATQRRELRRLFKNMKPQSKPYQESYYWAAFSAIGV